MKKFLNALNGEDWSPMEIETARSDACNMIWDVSYGGGCVSIYRLRNRVCVSVIKDVRDASKVKHAHAEPTGRDSYSYWIGLDVALRKALNKRLPPYILEKNSEREQLGRNTIRPKI